LIIHTPWNDTNLTHDLLYTTDLGSPINWCFLMRCISTNVIVPELCDAQGFFRLSQTNGNLTVTTNATPQQLAQLLVPPWVIVTNATYTGADVARGTFAGGNGCGLPIDSGVILASGPITNAIGPNNDDGSIACGNGSSDLSQPGDINLSNLVGGGNTHDAAVLEFDIIATNTFDLNSNTSLPPKNTRNGLVRRRMDITIQWRSLSAPTARVQTGSTVLPIILRWSRAPTCQ
jgi:hypothetical protein